MTLVIPPEILELLRSGRGVMTTADARAAGVSAAVIHELSKGGALVRVGRGAYVSKIELEDSTVWDRHALQTRGFIAGTSNVYAAELSAVAVRRVRRLGKPPPLPRVVRPLTDDAPQAFRRQGASTSKFGVTRTVPLAERYRSQSWGCPTVGPAWMVVDLARTVDRATALVVADAVVGSGTTKDGLKRALPAMRRWPGTERAQWVIEHANGRSESALETLGRLACIEHELPVPVSNAWVGIDRPVYRVDHLWPWHGVVAEGDGAMKYRDAADPATVVAEEKERQWFLEQELGLTVVRYGWDLAYGDRPQLATRFRRVLNSRGRLSVPIPWWETNDPFEAPRHCADE
jgi:hypothetical protein